MTHRAPLSAVLALVMALSACTSHMLAEAPSDPAQPWKPPASAGTEPVDGYGVAPRPEVAVLQPTPGIDARKTYGLAELIDIAQSENPLTRLAWQQARQAALAAGMVEATYLPFIAVNVIAGQQRVAQPLPVSIGSQDSVTTTVEGVSPQIALQWLLFDFGQRGALHKAAKLNADAANVLFNGAHQKIIYDVTRTYLLYGAARSRVRITARNLANSVAIEAAAKARVDKGVGTTVELAQARQAVAQARFGHVQAEGAEKDAYQALLAAIGLSPMTVIKVREPSGRQLPADLGRPTEEAIRTALARRPDVLASYSAMKASEAGIKAAEAEFLPKVYLGAIAATGDNDLSASGLPTIGQQASATGVVVGATMPIFDGGFRKAQLESAKSLAAASAATFQKTRDAAAREIVVGADALRSALASWRAASALTRAAGVTYDAAFEAYKAGVGDITTATAADTGLMTARLSEIDAYTASMVAAANLAFVLGAMTSVDAAGAR